MARGDRARRWGCEGESHGKRNTAEDSGGWVEGMEEGDDGVARCCEPRMGIGIREWCKRMRSVEGRWGRGGWLAWMGLGRRSVAVLILGQVTRVGTIHRRRRGGGGAKGYGRRKGVEGEQCRMVGAKHTPICLPTYPAGLTQNIILQIG